MRAIIRCVFVFLQILSIMQIWVHSSKMLSLKKHFLNRKLYKSKQNIRLENNKMDTITLETIHQDLELIKKEVAEIKEHMIDVDTILTEEDFKVLQDYKKEKAEGNLISSEELKKEVGL
mgnify:CR=1 FL=1